MHSEGILLITAQSFVYMGFQKSIGALIAVGNAILDLQFSHVGGLVQKNILSELSLATAGVGEQHCLANLKRMVASQDKT